MTGRRVRANAGEGGLLREQILVAAEELLVETGREDALTLRAVAARAGVTTPSVYLHFTGREALVQAVCLRVWDDLHTRLRKSVDRIEDPFRALGRCGHVYARFALDHPVQYRVLMMGTPSPAGVPAAAETCFRFFVRTVSRCVEAGVLRGDAEALTLSLWAAAHGCVSLLIAQPGFPWPDVDAMIDRTVRLAGYGAALSSRLPRNRTPAAPVLAAELDEVAARLADGKR